MDTGIFAEFALMVGRSGGTAIQNRNFKFRMRQESAGSQAATRLSSDFKSETFDGSVIIEFQRIILIEPFGNSDTLGCDFEESRREGERKRVKESLGASLTTQAAKNSLGSPKKDR